MRPLQHNDGAPGPALRHHEAERLLQAARVRKGSLLLDWFESQGRERRLYDGLVENLIAEALNDGAGYVVVSKALKEQFVRVLRGVMEGEVAVSLSSTWSCRGDVGVRWLTGVIQASQRRRSASSSLGRSLSRSIRGSLRRMRSE